MDVVGHVDNVVYHFRYGLDRKPPEIPVRRWGSDAYSLVCWQRLTDDFQEP